MQSRIRALVVATVVSLGVTMAVAGLVGASPDGPASRATVAHAGAAVTHAVPPVREAAVPPVRDASVPPAVLAAARSSRVAAQSDVQVITVAVVGSGLTLGAHEVRVDLHPTGRGSRMWTGTLPPVQVVDARGTHVGWTVRWSVSSSDAEPHGREGVVWVDPSAPAVIAGDLDGLVAGRPGPSLPGGRTLFSARPGWGGGTFEGGGSVSMLVPRELDSPGLSVTIRLEIA
jgi:hypothetical protein